MYLTTYERVQVYEKNYCAVISTGTLLCLFDVPVTRRHACRQCGSENTHKNQGDDLYRKGNCNMPDQCEKIQLGICHQKFILRLRGQDDCQRH